MAISVKYQNEMNRERAWSIVLEEEISVHR